MTFDRNPKFGADQNFSEGARRVTDLLWENTGGDLSAFPRSYLENLRHDFADGPAERGSGGLSCWAFT